MLRSLVNKVAIMTPVSPANSVLMCCDIQERFRTTIHKFPSVVSTASHLLAAGRILQLPLIVTEQYPKGLGHTVHELDIKHAVCRAEKTALSMMTGKAHEWINANSSRSNYILFGIESHLCILNTALDLSRSGKQVYIIVDGISSSHPSEVSVALMRLQQEGCVMATAESVLFEMVRDSAHPQFKALSELVKKMQKDPLRLSLIPLTTHKL